MDIISWNVKGLGRPAKRFLVKDFLNLYFADMCCLEESKLEEIFLATWHKIDGSWLDQFFFLPAKGTAGGIIMGWNSLAFTDKLASVGSFSLTIEFCSKRDNFKWHCTSVYDPNAQTQKHDFWDELRETRRLLDGP